MQNEGDVLMKATGYWIRQFGEMYICTLTDKSVQGLTQIFQSMGRTKSKAVRRMNRMLKPHGFRAEVEYYATYRV